MKKYIHLVRKYAAYQSFQGIIIGIGDRIGFRQPSSTQQALRSKTQVPSILDYGLILPPRLTVSLSQSGQYFPILLPKLSARVHINPHFKKGKWKDEFDFESLNITMIMYHREISEETLEPFKEALPLHEIQNKEPELLLEEVKQILRSLA
jgi:hypothetical protein